MSTNPNQEEQSYHQISNDTEVSQESDEPAPKGLTIKFKLLQGQERSCELSAVQAQSETIGSVKRRAFSKEIT